MTTYTEAQKTWLKNQLWYNTEGFQAMPVISRFYGISVMMFFKDHNPPHFHARYGGAVALFNIKTHQVMAGSISPHAVKLVSEWTKLHKKELLANWERAQRDEPVKPIEPLE